MSISHRLLTIETVIPYEDVVPSWKGARDEWSSAVVTAPSAKMLATQTLKLLDALTPACVAFYWPKRADFEALQKTIRTISSGEKADPRGLALRDSIRQCEARVLPVPPESELSLLADGKPDELALDDAGPELHIGSKCAALDIRNMWCAATIVGRHQDSSGQTMYKVHYEGWKQRWDEWLARDSGRVRRDPPAPSLEGASKRSETMPATAAHRKSSATSVARKVAAKNVTKATPSRREEKPTAGRGIAKRQKEGATTQAKGAVEKPKATGRGQDKGVGKKTTPIDKKKPAAQENAKGPVNKMKQRLKTAISNQRKLKSSAPDASETSAAPGKDGDGEQAPPPDSTPLDFGCDVRIGDRVVALDVRNIWCDAVVSDIRRARYDRKVISGVRLRYVGWGRKWDEWHTVGDGRVRRVDKPKRGRKRTADAKAASTPAKKSKSSSSKDVKSAQKKVKLKVSGLGDAVSSSSRSRASARAAASAPTKSSRGVSPASGKPAAASSAGKGAAGAELSLKVGDICWALDENMIWCEAKVLRLAKGRVRVHYLGFKKTFDEWKELVPSQIRHGPPPTGAGSSSNAAHRAASSGIKAAQPVDVAAAAKTGGSGMSGSLAGASASVGVPTGKRRGPKAADRPSFAMYPPTDAFPFPPPVGASGRGQQPDEADDVGPPNLPPIFASEEPISLGSPALDGPVASLPSVPTVRSLDPISQRDLLRQLQVTRDFLRTVQNVHFLIPSFRNYLVRLNMGSKFFMYVAAQIVDISKDELTVRGVDKASGTQQAAHEAPTNVINKTKLAYVSNAVLKEEELDTLVEKLRNRQIDDLPVPDVVALIEAKKRVMSDPNYLRVKQQQTHASANAHAAPQPEAQPSSSGGQLASPPCAERVPAPSADVGIPVAQLGQVVVQESSMPIPSCAVMSNASPASMATSAAVMPPPAHVNRLMPGWEAQDPLQSMIVMPPEHSRMQ